MGAVEKQHAEVAAPAAWDYAPAPEAREIVSFERRYGLFIGGEQVAPRSRSLSSVICSTGCPECSAISWAMRCLV